jgi:hypothetical protein
MTNLYSNSHEDIALAVWAAHAACAINTGSEYALAEVREMLEKKLSGAFYYVAAKTSEPLAITVIKELLILSSASTPVEPESADSGPAGSPADLEDADLP